MNPQGFRQELTTVQLTMLAVGAIIGSGVFVLTGLGIEKVGNIAPFIYLLAALVVILNSVPTLISGTTLPTTGGYYKYISRLLDPTVGFYYMWTRVIGLFSLSAVVLSFGQYVQILFPNVGAAASSLWILLIITVLNLSKNDVLGNINKYVVYILIGSLGLFVFSGLPRLDLSRMAVFSRNTADEILLVVVYYMFALDGAPVIVNLGGECKKPRRSVPIAIVAGISLSAVIYSIICFIAICAAADYNVLKGAPLGEYARTFMQPAVFTFFILGGALLGIVSTLNASLMVMPRILWAGAKDGLFPSFFAALSRNGIPARMLTAVSLIVAVPIVLNYDIGQIVSIVGAPNALIMLGFNFSILAIPKKFPRLYRRSFGKLPVPVLAGLILAASAVSVRLSVSAFKNLNSRNVIGLAVFYGVGTLYYFFLKSRWRKTGKSFRDLSQYDERWIQDEKNLEEAGL